jgi:hypothetical protein
MKLTMKRIFDWFALLALVAGQSFAAEPARPNILLLIADDLGFSDVGCYGGEIKTAEEWLQHLQRSRRSP